MAEKTFVRDATGLVKSISTFQAFVINNSVLNVLIGTPLSYTTILFLFPGVNVPLAFVIGALVSVPWALVYIQMGAAMPRSGGDYAWISRTLSPALGFMTSWTLIAFSVFSALPLISYGFSSFFLSSVLGVLGALTGNAGISSLATMVGTPDVAYAIASAMLIGMAALAIAGGNILRRAYYILFGLMILGVLLIAGLFAVTPHSTFVQEFNNYSSTIGSDYNGILSAATKAGWVPTTSLYAAFAALPLTLSSYGGFTYAAYLGGEVKRPEKALNRSIMLTLALGLLMWAGLAVLLFNTVGGDFMNATAYLTYVAPTANPMKVSAFMPLYTTIMSAGNPIVFWLILLGFVVSYLVIVPAYFQVVARGMFAWSFDRVGPSFLADVNNRTHTPIKAIIAALVAAEIFLVLWAFTSYVFVFLNGTILFLGIFIIPGIAAAIFPFRKKSLFENSPKITKMSLGGVPVLTIAGVILVLSMAYSIVFSYQTPAYSGPTSWQALVIILGVFVSGIVLFYVAKAYRKSTGLDLNAIYKEIPPE